MAASLRRGKAKLNRSTQSVLTSVVRRRRAIICDVCADRCSAGPAEQRQNTKYLQQEIVVASPTTSKNSTVIAGLVIFEVGDPQVSIWIHWDECSTAVHHLKKYNSQHQLRADSGHAACAQVDGPSRTTTNDNFSLFIITYVM